MTSISPTNSPTPGSGFLTINGRNFGVGGSSAAAAAATVGGVACSPVQSLSHTRLVCTVPAGEDVNVPVSLVLSHFFPAFAWRVTVAVFWWPSVRSCRRLFPLR